MLTQDDLAAVRAIASEMMPDESERRKYVLFLGAAIMAAGINANPGSGDWTYGGAVKCAEDLMMAVEVESRG